MKDLAEVEEIVRRLTTEELEEWKSLGDIQPDAARRKYLELVRAFVPSVD